MPGVTDVALIDTGIAVRAATFGQCIDAVRAMDVEWNPGTVEGESDETILAKVRKAELPLAVPKVPVLAKTVEADVHLHVPQQRRARAVRRHRRRARRQRRRCGPG